MRWPTESWSSLVAALGDEGRCLAVGFDEAIVALYARLASDAIQDVRGGCWPAGRPLTLWAGLLEAAAAENPGEPVMLALERGEFDGMLRQAVHKDFVPSVHGSRAGWRLANRHARVTLEWGPAMDPEGRPVSRSAASWTVRAPAARVLVVAAVCDVQDGVALLEGARTLGRVPVQRPYPLPDRDLHHLLRAGAS